MAMEDASTCGVSRRDATDRPRTPRPAERSTANVERRASQHRLYCRAPLDPMGAAGRAACESSERRAGSGGMALQPGARYEVTDQFAVFGSAGRTFRASSRVEERPLMFLVGVEITYGSEN